MDIQSLVQAQRSHFQTGAALGLTARRTALKRLGAAIRAHERDISAALMADLNKSSTEGYMCEVGLTLSDGYTCLPAELELLGECEALVTLREGKYHQIKRMCAARGKPVVFLKRLTFGTLTLDETLAPGEWRELKKEEVEGLRGK